jgi:predicted metal-binding membrane protein
LWPADELAWVAALGALVLVEKLLRQGPLVARLAGVLFVAWGLYLVTLRA